MKDWHRRAKELAETLAHEGYQYEANMLGRVVEFDGEVTKFFGEDEHEGEQENGIRGLVDR